MEGFCVTADEKNLTLSYQLPLFLALRKRPPLLDFSDVTPAFSRLSL
jgi:hypothetical protein